MIASNLSVSARLISTMAEDRHLCDTLAAAAAACVTCLKGGGKILLAGNGGSAADAQHIAAELVGRFAFDRPGLPAIALTTDTSILTAVGNDYGFDRIFDRQVQALGRKGDLFIAYSTSGSSKNIVQALDVARAQGLVTIGLTGAMGPKSPMAPRCGHLLAVPSETTAHIQEGHLVLGHTLCGLIENEIFKESK